MVAQGKPKAQPWVKMTARKCAPENITKDCKLSGTRMRNIFNVLAPKEFPSFKEGKVNYFTILSYEALIPLISEELKPRCSISFKPTMVQPLGVVTLSISSSG